MKKIDQILNDLEDSITTAQYKRIESEYIELKDNSHTGGAWDSMMESVCAFLNTDGGIIIIGIKEDVFNKNYTLKGFNFDNESSLKQILEKITDAKHHKVDISSYVKIQQKDFLGKQLMIVYVDSVPADMRYVFYKGTAYERVMSQDCKLSALKIEVQNEYKQEINDAKELRPVANASTEDLDIDKLNYYIQLLNSEIKIQNILPSIIESISFLTRNGMVRDRVPTILGMLVCGKNPGEFLHWRSEVDAYVELPTDMPINKKILNDNILPLLEQSQAFVFRNIQTGISLERGGMKTFEYPEELIRESINNSLAHRDYSINQFVNINIIPGKHIQIKNPGRFKKQLLIIDDRTDIPIKRIVPNPKANNPKLAKVLSVYNKWEGKGRGMKNLVSAALDGHIDLPYYVFHSLDELSLFIPKGKLVDDRIESLIDAFSKHIQIKVGGDNLSEAQKSVFAYFYKSEIQNRNERFTLLLTQDNNHLEEIAFLEAKGLIFKHACSNTIDNVYVVDRVFFVEDYYRQLREIYGGYFDDLTTDYKQVLNAIFQFKTYSFKSVSANLIGNYIFYKQHRGIFDLKSYENFKRKVRNQINTLEDRKFILSIESPTKSGSGNRTTDYVINQSFKRTPSLFD